jgi:hypothetical protein
MLKTVVNLMLAFCCLSVFSIHARESENDSVSLLTPFRISLPAPDVKINYIDLDGDGDPDVLRSSTLHGTPVQWIDDDDDMQEGDLEGDLDNDCLMIDRNKDGKYGSGHDLIIDWNDENGDGQPDMQVVADNSGLDDRGRFRAHYIWIIDKDHDQILNYIDWNTFELEGWEHAGRCHFFEDYIGQSIMLKSHTSSFNIKDVRYSWENPFLFFDQDGDGLTEMAIRLTDQPEIDQQARPLPEEGNITDVMRSFQFDGVINNVYLTIDLDNDNSPSNEFDYDLSLKFSGAGFNYRDQVHKYESMKGLPGSEIYFYDTRWREMTELIYADHDSAYNLVFQRGKWSACWLTYDEDDDCQRWERVEFYEPRDPFKAGVNNGGLDNNAQADVTGDRGEWDLDFSGRGQLYIGPFDGRIHLYGAEWGCWRIDQNANYFQGWQGWRGANIQPEDHVSVEPEIFPTIKYSDKNNNGFFDLIEYDLNGDKEFERTVDLISLEIPDTAALICTAGMEYKDFKELHATIANQLWENALQAVNVAKKERLNTGWYSILMNPGSVREKYHNGYWLNFYLYMDLRHLGEMRQDQEFIELCDKAYFGNDWSIML